MAKWIVVTDRLGRNPAYFRDGVVATKEEFDAAFPSKPIGAPEVPSTSAWPMTSMALAVHPEQVAEANERNKVHGVGVRYDETGLAHLPDRAERKKLLKLEKFHDNQGGYGD